MYFKIYIGESENGLFGQNPIIIRIFSGGNILTVIMTV